jgi:hypothetical protein
MAKPPKLIEPINGRFEDVARALLREKPAQQNQNSQQNKQGR